MPGFDQHYLWIGVQVANALHIDDYKAVATAFECEVREGLCVISSSHMHSQTNLWCLSRYLRDESRVRVVLDIFAFDEVLKGRYSTSPALLNNLEMIQRLLIAIDELDSTHLHDVDL